MKFCAFLRGVNIGGKSMKMTDAIAVFEQAGMKNVTSVLATGNLIFSSESEAADLKVLLEKSLSEYFDYEAFIFLRDEDQIKKTISKNPFEKSSENHIYVFVTTPGTEKILMQEFEKGNKTENEKAEIADGNFYWQVAKGNTLDSDFGKILGKKALKDKLTSRNLNTFEKIINKF